MSRLTKKLQSGRAMDFGPGEAPTATTLVQPEGVMLPATAVAFLPLVIGVVLFGAIGGALGGAFAVLVYTVAPRLVSRSPGDGLAAGVGSGTRVLAVTPQRLLVFGYNALSGKPAELQTAYSLGQVTSATWVKGVPAGKLTLSFVDGSTARFDSVQSGPFIESFQQAAAR